MSEEQPFIPVCEPALLGNELEYVSEAVRTGWISSSGKYVGEFERSFAEYCGVKYGVGVCNGTVAIHLALRAAGVGPGDEVVIPDFTMIATAFAVCYAGAKPVFVDVDARTWNMDPDAFEAAITSKTKAVIPVHIMGLPCAMNAIQAIADRHGIAVIEDAAESHGAEYDGRKTGGLAKMAAFSFFANKNLTTGEGGMVVTDDEELYQRLKYLKNLAFPLGAAREYVHDEIGFNYRLSNLHAAVGLAQVEKADDYRRMRIENHELYRKHLSDIPGIEHQFDPVHDSGVADGSETRAVHVHWMNAICLDPKEFGVGRDELMSRLKAVGIDSRKLFTGMHRQKSLRDYGCDVGGEFPQTDRLAANGLYLPSSSTLDEAAIRRICAAVRDAR
ncbi:MAG: DegT/DnrJ/EryC1/StrS family aminotransferase [bacterium]|nr:DegT/DnrJ/EryC1/StrS family aminotransferase [bacterium]